MAPGPPSMAAAPKAPNSTLPRDRFMALHMMLVRISPDAPTKAPLTISALDSMTNPAADAAIPENEFRKEMTTGMSAPPMGSTRTTPSTSATATSTQNTVGPAPATTQTARPSARAASAASPTRWPG